MKKLLNLSLSLILLTLASFIEKEPADLSGVWVRKSDELRIKISTQSDETLFSFIIENGNEPFPCDVSHLPIYKNINRVGKNLWTCEFLVVTMGSCATEYEEGIIRITQNGDMEITCPGFEKKVYSKLKPRYDGM